MITVEIKINGTIIGHLYLHNIGQSARYGYHDYEGHFYDAQSAIVTPITCSHMRGDGAVKLINIATKKIMEALNKKEVEALSKRRK